MLPGACTTHDAHKRKFGIFENRVLRKNDYEELRLNCRFIEYSGPQNIIKNRKWVGHTQNWLIMTSPRQLFPYSSPRNDFLIRF